MIGPLLGAVTAVATLAREIVQAVRQGRERRREERCAVCDGRPAVSCPVCGSVARG